MAWCSHRHRPMSVVQYVAAAYAGPLYERQHINTEYGTYVRIISNCVPMALAVREIVQRVGRAVVGSRMPRRVPRGALRKLVMSENVGARRFMQCYGAYLLRCCELQMTMLPESS